MTMIGVGRRQLDIANRGLAAVSRAESVEENQRLAIEAQKTAAQNSTLGLGAGIAAQVGLKSIAATKAAGASAGGVSNIGSTINGLSGQGGIETAQLAGDLGSQALTSGGVNNVGTALKGLKGGVEGIQIAETAAAGAEVGGAINNVGAALEGVSGAIEAGTVVAEAGAVGATAGTTGAVAGTAGTGAAAAGTGAAAGAGGTAATLGAIAAPVAIGLGVAFLLNKLFD